jgi:hypothetical protein
VVLLAGRINPEWREGYECRKCAMLLGRARNLNVSVSAYVDAAERNIRSWVGDAAVRIRVNEAGLAAFLRDGRYKVMEDTGVSGGDLRTLTRRRQVEHEILDIPVDSPGSARPVSGYLEGSDEGGPISTYGCIVLELDSRVRPSTWFLLGDLVDTPTLGLGQTLLPEPVTRPSISAGNGRVDVASATTLPDACGDHRYAEALIYGGVTPDDLERVVYTRGLQPSDEVRAYGRTAAWELFTTTESAPNVVRR